MAWKGEKRIKGSICQVAVRKHSMRLAKKEKRKVWWEALLSYSLLI